MKLITETIEDKQKILIITKKNFSFIKTLKKELENYGNEVFLSPSMPKNLSLFVYCFEIDEKKWIFTNLKKDKHQKKIIEIKGSVLKKEDIDKILWFLFSETKETHLKITLPEYHPPLFQKKIKISLSFSKKNIIFTVLIIFILLHLSFFIPLAISLFSSYQAFAFLKKEQKEKAENMIDISTSSFFIAKNLYSLTRPSFLLFSIAALPDNLIEFVEQTNNILKKSILLTENAAKIQHLLFKKNKSEEEKIDLILRIKKAQKEMFAIGDQAKILIRKLPSSFTTTREIKIKLVYLTELIEKTKKIMPYFDLIISKKEEQKYLLLFANNMELRPGGGFLGSFGILKIRDYTIEDIKIYDVYDADGQLSAHIEPPEPVRKYLHHPHGFLRDSNFSPDFPENYEKAKIFLDKSMNFKDFSGAVLITTTAIENILDAFGNIYLPDFNEYINKKNFYIKTQFYVEKNFFPGSIQKKTFLNALTKQLIINLETASPKKMIEAIKKSLDEKQIVIYLENQDLQKIIDPFYWSGRLITPQCLTTTTTNCIVDYLFPYDANVGVNKANFFINRSIYLKIKIASDGQIRHLFSVQFQNQSPAEVFPGGTYKNYFQLMIPLNSTLKQVVKDGVLIDNYEEKIAGQFKILGIYFEVPPKSNSEIKIEYMLNEKLKNGRGIYQLIMQKQIGSLNNDYIFEMELAKNIYIINQNFTPLVKNNSFVYNSSLTADKIFFIELAKE